MCGAIQTSEKEVLIFGGSDYRIKDQQAAFVFRFEEHRLEHRSDLVRPQVFVDAPFLYNRKVFAIGNEYYYMKQRNIHRYSVKADEWSVVF